MRVVRQPFHTQDGRACPHVECRRGCVIRQRRINGQRGVAQRHACVLLQHKKHVARCQICAGHNAPKGFRQPRHFQRYRCAIQQPHAMQFGDGRAGRKLQRLRYIHWRGHRFQPQHAVVDAVALRGHRLRKALQRRHVLERLRRADKVAMAAEDQPFVLQIGQCLAYGDAAGAKLLAQGGFGWQQRIGRGLSAEDDLAQRALDSLIERRRGQAGRGWGRRHLGANSS